MECSAFLRVSVIDLIVEIFLQVGERVDRGGGLCHLKESDRHVSKRGRLGLIWAHRCVLMASSACLCTNADPKL